jgi:hypothetical protein
LGAIRARKLPMKESVLRLLCWGQGFYFLVTALWPLFSMSTFEMVTGPKTDDWLVKTVAVLILVSSAVLLRAAVSNKASIDTLIIGAGTSVALLHIDLVYVQKAVISKIYLADAVAELICLGLWAWCSPKVLQKQ